MTPYDHPPGSPPSEEPARARPPALKRRSSQKRQRSKTLQIAVTPEKYAEVQALAAAAEISVSDWGYTIIFSSPGPRARRRPQVQEQVLGRVSTELNYLGNNLNQATYKLNALGEVALARQYAAALVDLRRTLHVVREAAAGRACDCDDCHDYQGQPAR